jgi:hypothetical protein
VSEDQGETPQERHARYLRLAGETDEQAEKATNAQARGELRAVAKSWRRLARELELKELGLG